MVEEGSEIRDGATCHPKKVNNGAHSSSCPRDMEEELLFDPWLVARQPGWRVNDGGRRRSPESTRPSSANQAAASRPSQGAIPPTSGKVGARTKSEGGNQGKSNDSGRVPFQNSKATTLVRTETRRLDPKGKGPMGGSRFGILSNTQEVSFEQAPEGIEFETTTDMEVNKLVVEDPTPIEEDIPINNPVKQTAVKRLRASKSDCGSGSSSPKMKFRVGANRVKMAVGNQQSEYLR